MQAPLVLPRDLAGVAEYLTAAIREVDIPGDWPGEKFVEAKQPSAIGRALIGAIHTHLAAASVVYLFVEEMASNNRIVYGKATKAAGVLEHLTGFDFVLTFNWTEWLKLSPAQRIALVDHELTHCAHGEKSWELVGHDVEEFGVIVGRWGLWRQGLREFHAAASHAQQDLFADAVDAVAKEVETEFNRLHPNATLRVERS